MTDVKTKAGTREWIGLSVLVLGSLLITIDIGVLYFALPPISEALKPSGTQQLWIMDIYAFGLAGLMITMGWLGDKFGRRRMLMIGAVVFGVASVCSAYSNSPGMLIGSRALLGVGGAILTPTALALISNMFHNPKERKTAIAAFSGTISAGAAIGPILGGLLLGHFWWGSVFLINVPVMLLLLILAPLVLPEFSNPAHGRLDVLGVLLSLAAILPLIWGIKELAINGYSTTPTVALIAGAIFFIAFLLRQRSTTSPLIDLSLFKARGFSGGVVINLLVMLAFAGASLLTNQFLQLVLGYSALKAALWSLAVSPVVGGATGVIAPLAHKVKPGNLLAGAMAMIVIGFGFLTQVHTSSGVWLVLAGSAGVGAGLVASKQIINEIVVTSAPPERAGSAVAVSETFSEFGAALGVATLGSIASAVFHKQMAGVTAAGLDDKALHAARDTLGGTTAVAAQLPQGGQDLLNAGRTAFVHGLNLTAIVGVVGVAALALFFNFYLRRTPVLAGFPEPPAGPPVETSLAAEPAV
ncbi:MFS transporter [Streptomyces tateyamensis]|uniref:MFS transporter n=1 Tax=Streptomyces tateyamensis TaxID=565073 RepID=A0A2V4N0T2_9ACTN|nr:MFS transporter [Streptomyces tateyamensis]PYC77448.1 MFS transporter [Streptomyces tateyamensis]